MRLGNPDGLLPQPDLLLFRVDPPPDLPRLPIRSTPPGVATPLLMVGLGRGRGERIHFEDLPGWDWEGPRAKRWGTNEVARTPVFDRRKDAPPPHERVRIESTKSPAGLSVQILWA